MNIFAYVHRYMSPAGAKQKNGKSTVMSTAAGGTTVRRAASAVRGGRKQAKASSCELRAT